MDSSHRSSQIIISVLLRNVHTWLSSPPARGNSLLLLSKGNMYILCKEVLLFYCSETCRPVRRYWHWMFDVRIFLVEQWEVSAAGELINVRLIVSFLMIKYWHRPKPGDHSLQDHVPHPPPVPAHVITHNLHLLLTPPAADLKTYPRLTIVKCTLPLLVGSYDYEKIIVIIKLSIIILMIIMLITIILIIVTMRIKKCENNTDNKCSLKGTFDIHDWLRLRMIVMKLAWVTPAETKRLLVANVWERGNITSWVSQAATRPVIRINKCDITP